MNTDWTTFLKTHAGAAYPSGAQNAARMTLPPRASIRVSGDEAGVFLQAILTQEVLICTPNTAAYAALCNAKGRTLSTLLVHPIQTGVTQEYRLTVPADLTPELVKTLKLYMLRRKVSLTLDSDWGFFGLINPTPFQMEELGFTDSPPQPLDQRITPDGLIATWEQRTESPRMSVQGPTKALIEYWERLSSSTETVSGRVWDQAEIQDGIARITPETYLHFVPQWLNLDLKGGISFKKGCYPGQEVIARLHYLGKPNRRLLIGQCDRPDELAPGTAITLRDDTTVDAGEIVTSVPQNPLSGTGQLFLAVLRLKHVHDTLTVEGAPCTLYPDSLPALESQNEDEEAQTH